MADEEELLSSESGENTMLREAIEALRRGEKARTRDILTRLLKTDQQNAEYWVWLSAAVETQKERIYCLQTAIQIDPKNAAAKRGLILFGALPPDDSVPPFPVNRPRLWEEKLKASQISTEKPGPWANPVTRMFIVLGIAVVVVGLFVGGYMAWSRNARPAFSSSPTRPHYVTLTPTPSPTITLDRRTPSATFRGATPLWMFLDKTYTPTPFYVATQHPITSRSAFESGLRRLGTNDYADALVLFQQAQVLEPDAPDIYYYIGEVWRGEGNYHLALDGYQKAINKNPNFAPAFLGRALANMSLFPSMDVTQDLNQAINLDPNFTEAYIERGKYLLQKNPSAAESDFQTAVATSPNSALAYLYLSKVQLVMGENQSALESAQHANQIDITLIPAYLALAQAYIATGQSDQAVGVLQTYTVYAPGDTSAFLALGTAYNAAKQYQAAVDYLSKAIGVDRKNAEAYYQRGYAYIGLQNGSQAVADFKLAVAYAPSDFDAQLGLARALDVQKKPGDAYMQAETKALPLAKTDPTKAQVYYWEAVFLEEINEKAGANASWYRLIGLPANVMPGEWRNQAFQYLNITPTYTPTVPPTYIPSYTPTPTLVITTTSTPTPTK